MSEGQKNKKQTIEAEVRTNSGKGVARKLRAAGKLPGTLYGYKLDEPKSLVLDPEVIYDLLTTFRRSNNVFKLNLGDVAYENVMVKEYQIDPVKRSLVHADLVVVNPDQPVHVSVPVKVFGRPVGVRQGGRLQMVRNQVPVTCKPNDIPLSIEHDVTKLSLGQAVLASQLTLPEGLEADWPVDFAVVRIAIPRGAAVIEGEEEESEEDSE